jgi:hypothetical protein
MARKTVFISFDYDNDRHYKNLLLAWDANDEFDFGFYDGSLRDAIDSTNADYIKSKIRPMIRAATHFLCLIGKDCASSPWILWEIDRAVEFKKKLIAVKIEKDNTTPLSLIGVGATWAMSFNFDAIKKALESA